MGRSSTDCSHLGHGPATHRLHPQGPAVIDSAFTSVTFVALNSALDGLSMRQRVIADNIANVQTPGFRAGRVSFEASLAEAVREGTGAATPTVARSLEPGRPDGNNVNLDTETLYAIETNLRYQLATRAVDGTFEKLRIAMRTS